MFVPRRVEKLLHDATTHSVAEIRCALSERRVAILTDGRARSATLGELVFDDDAVLLDGIRVTARTVHEHVVLNKPLSVTCTLSDPEGKADLAPFVRQMSPGIFPIGRLDRATSGLLLFTTDGDLAQAVLHPDHRTEKLYWLWLDEHVSDDDARLQLLVRGFQIRGGFARAERARVLGRTADATELLITLRQGKNRQIRRMCRALDFRLVALHRKAVGPIELGDLPLGAWRALHANEVDALWAATGGRRQVFARKIAALERHATRVRAEGQPDRRLEAWLVSASSKSSLLEQDQLRD